MQLEYPASVSFENVTWSLTLVVAKIDHYGISGEGIASAKLPDFSYNIAVAWYARQDREVASVLLIDWRWLKC